VDGHAWTSARRPSKASGHAHLNDATVARGLYRALHDKQALTDAMLCEEMRGTQPLSVSRREDVERLREMARGRFVPA